MDMAIITLRDIETNNNLRVKSVIDPGIKFDSSGKFEIIKNIKWMFEDTELEVPIEFHDSLNHAKLDQYVGLQYVIIKIETN